MKRYTWLFTLFLLVYSTMSCDKEEEDNLDINKLNGVWVLDRFIDKNNNTLIAPEIHISYFENNCVTMFAPCLSGQGHFSLRGQNITISDMKLNERCNTSPESYFFQSLISMGNLFIMNLSGFYQISSDTLRIMSDNEFELIFHKTQSTNSYQCDISNLLIDSFDNTLYYSEDIFSSDYSNVYGKWYVYSVHGGFGGGEQLPHFDFLELKRNGIYGVINGFKLLEYGKFYIESKLSDGRIVLNFVPDNNFVPDSINSAPGWSYISKRLSFLGNDTIIFQDYGCLDCYRYSFLKIK